MPTTVKELTEQAANLPDMEKLALVNALLEQLDRPDPEIDHIWLEEVRRRIQAHREGRIESRSFESIMEKYKRP